MVEMWSAAVVVCYPHPMPDASEQLARDRARLAELEARWLPLILDFSHDEAMRWYRTGKEIPELRRRISSGLRLICIDSDLERRVL